MDNLWCRQESRLLSLLPPPPPSQPHTKDNNRIKTHKEIQQKAGDCLRHSPRSTNSDPLPAAGAAAREGSSSAQLFSPPRPRADEKDHEYSSPPPRRRQQVSAFVLSSPKQEEGGSEQVRLMSVFSLPSISALTSDLRVKPCLHTGPLPWLPHAGAEGRISLQGKQGKRRDFGIYLGTPQRSAFTDPSPLARRSCRVRLQGRNGKGRGKRDTECAPSFISHLPRW